jgi:xylulose-5-phosphate/fructose-6-phosphate phosphoketolase
VRVVNVVDLMRLEPDSKHPHGMSDEFDSLFTHSKPVVFAYHGHPSLIHRLTYRRANHANLRVRGYKEEGTTTTPFDMVMLTTSTASTSSSTSSTASPASRARQHTCASR